jgi:hypothetical protein
MIPNETSERKRIKDYWEESIPMSFLDKKILTMKRKEDFIIRFKITCMRFLGFPIFVIS